MGLAREPIDIDFYVTPKPLTKDEKKNLSDFIQQRKKDSKTNEQTRNIKSLKKKSK